MGFLPISDPPKIPYFRFFDVPSEKSSYDMSDVCQINSKGVFVMLKHGVLIRKKNWGEKSWLRPVFMLLFYAEHIYVHSGWSGCAHMCARTYVHSGWGIFYRMCLAWSELLPLQRTSSILVMVNVPCCQYLGFGVTKASKNGAKVVPKHQIVTFYPVIRVLRHWNIPKMLFNIEI